MARARPLLEAGVPQEQKQEITMDIRRRHILAIAALPAMLLLANGALAQEPFPNINDAEGHLYAALDSLHRAPSDFRGHKAEAIRLLRHAISELEIAKQVAY
jgi:hypothetical protein